MSIYDRISREGEKSRRGARKPQVRSTDFYIILYLYVPNRIILYYHALINNAKMARAYCIASLHDG
jgi:hypothetical protein